MDHIKSQADHWKSTFKNMAIFVIAAVLLVAAAFLFYPRLEQVDFANFPIAYLLLALVLPVTLFVLLSWFVSRQNLIDQVNGVSEDE